MSDATRLLRWFFLIVVVTLPVDQWTKQYSTSHFLVHEDQGDTTIYQGRREELVSSQIGSAWFTLHMTYVRNHGASWGAFRDLGETTRRPVLILIGAILGAALLFGAIKINQSGHKMSSYAVTVLVAGSVGNFLDRVRIGYVVDFISFRCGAGSSTWVLPSFNIADIIIVVALFWASATIFFTPDPKNEVTR